MSQMDVKQLRKALESAGLEVFRVRGDEIHLAVRQNVQMMEARVQVRAGASPRVMVATWSQRSDAPQWSDDQLFALVRDRAAALRAAGYDELGHERREIRSVSDESQVLDVWFEVSFARAVESLDEATAEALRVIAFERYVVASRQS
ncbi:MAG: hypothetical protein JNK72_24520 [Myxococcales bacterium]|nr:hypothetical protein [Myxococcales bacterium]